MVLNIRLRDRISVTPEDEDSMGRAWYGFDPGVSADELWATNRGRYSISSKRFEDERYATFVFRGKVVLVAEFDDWELVEHPEPRQKIALIGRPLSVGHPVYDALIGTDAGRGRFTVWYTPDPGEVKDPAPARTVLLTWNPSKWDWGIEYDIAIDNTSQGQEVSDRWSTGRRSSGLQAGNRAFLLRQGPEPRGIVASGWVTSGVVQDEHWDGSGREGNYVDVAWDVVLSEDEMLSTEELQSGVPDQDWTPQASGTLVGAESLRMLELAWSDHLSALTQSQEKARTETSGRVDPSNSGQGRQLDAAVRKKIEDAAQDRLMKVYEDEGWTVTDTRYGNPFDATAERDGQILYLEAKGTNSPGVTVTLTRGEVEHARANPGEWIVGIWSGIRFLDDGEVDPQSGRFVVMEATPDDDALEIIDYRWRVPSA